MINILINTPTWVYILFAGLVYLGWKQSRTRVISRNSAFILPIAMIILSYLGVTSSVGTSPSVIVTWLIGMLISSLIGYKLFSGEGVEFSAETKQFTLVGSWIPFIFIMAIFFTKYTVGVMLAMKSTLLTSPENIYGLSFIYGALSGVFTARALRYWQVAQSQK